MCQKEKIASGNLELSKVDLLQNQPGKLQNIKRKNRIQPNFNNYYLIINLYEKA